MSKKLHLPLLLAFVCAFVGCKKMGPMSADLVTVNPTPLEVIGGKVPATINGTFPEKYFDKSATVTVTPTLVYEGGEAVSQSYVFEGEKVEGNNTVVSYKEGGNYTIKAVFNYVPEMRNSDLYLAATVQKGSKTYDLPRVKIGEGVVSSAEIADAMTASPSLAADKFQRIIKDSYDAKILFLIQQTMLRSNQLNSDEMKAFHEDLKAAVDAPNKELTGINVTSVASPDGAVDLNTKIASGREKNSVKYMEGQLKKADIASDITAEFTAEDWAGFQELVSKSDIQDKALILRVLSMYSDPDQRESEIKNMSSIFSVLADEILPQLRYSKITASIDIIGKSDAELSQLAASNPSELTIEELLYAATLADNSKAIYEKAVKIYPNDYRAYNNIGNIEFAEGNLDTAKSWFNKAAKVNASAPETQMNLGLVAIAEGDLAAAESAFAKAAGVNELGEALGVLYLEKGQYTKAVNAFGNTKSNNAALAQILTKDYSKAKSTLSAVDADATTYYLMAIVGARTNNEQMVKSNLQAAVKADASMAQMAKTDLEFSKYNVVSYL